MTVEYLTYDDNTTVKTLVEDEVSSIVYLEDWLSANNEPCTDSLRCNILDDDGTEDDYDEAYADLEERFFEWCNENDVDGETV